MIGKHTASRTSSALVAVVGVVLLGPGQVNGQAPAATERAYYQAVAGYFQVAPEEVAILGEWDLRAEEVPVVLFVAGRAGVPPDIVVSLRRGGSSWSDVAGRYRMDATAFYVPFNNGDGGSLSRAFRAYSQTPERDWGGILLEDGEIVSLVNIRVLSQDLALAPARVLEARDDAGDYLTGYETLTRRR